MQLTKTYKVCTTKEYYDDKLDDMVSVLMEWDEFTHEEDAVEFISMQLETNTILKPTTMFIITCYKKT